MITKKFRVTGSVTVTVGREVEITFDETDEDFQNGDGTVNDYAVKDAAIEKAAADFGGLGEFIGNGGTDKLIGVYDSEDFIEADGEVEFTEADEAE